MTKVKKCPISPCKGYSAFHEKLKREIDITQERSFSSYTNGKKFEEKKNNNSNYDIEIYDMLLEKTMDQKRNHPLIDYKQYSEVKKVWDFKGDNSKTVVTHSHIPQPLTYKNLKTLSGRTWLNDEVYSTSPLNC